MGSSLRLANKVALSFKNSDTISVMKIKDLINQLSKYDPNLPIRFTATLESHRGYCGTTLQEYIVIEKAEEGEEYTNNDGECLLLKEDTLVFRVEGEQCWSE